MTTEHPELSALVQDLESFLLHKNPPTLVTLAALMLIVDEVAMGLQLPHLRRTIEMMVVVLDRWVTQAQDLEAARIAKEENTIC